MKKAFLFAALATFSAPSFAHADGGHIVTGMALGALQCPMGAIAAGTVGHAVGIRLPAKATKAYEVLVIGGGAVGCVAGAGAAYYELKESQSPSESDLAASQAQEAIDE